MTRAGEPRRLRRERRTIEAMVDLYCRGNHDGAAAPGGCGECSELLDYARARIVKCPFHDDKPPCASCPIHCYMPDRREQVKKVMRYAGPRMLLRHPIFAIRHWLDGFRAVPPGPERRRRPRP